GPGRKRGTTREGMGPERAGPARVGSGASPCRNRTPPVANGGPGPRRAAGQGTGRCHARRGPPAGRWSAAVAGTNADRRGSRCSGGGGPIGRLGGRRLWRGGARRAANDARPVPASAGHPPLQVGGPVAGAGGGGGRGPRGGAGR